MSPAPFHPFHKVVVAGLITLPVIVGAAHFSRAWLAEAQSPAGSLLTQTPPAATAQPTTAPVALPSPSPLLEIPTDQIVLTAIPPRLGDGGELKAKPGEKIQAMVRVRNSSNKPLAVRTLIQDFVIGEDGETPVAVSSEVSNRWSLANWVTISPANQMIPAHQTAQVNLVIDVPKDALPGGHYAMVLHEPNTSGVPSAGDTSSRVAQRVGTLVYFFVDGPVNEEAFIRNFTIPQWNEYGPVPFSFTVENLSDMHIKPSITVDMYNVIGQKVDSVVVETKNVFPFVARNFEGKWNRVWGIGPYKARIVMSFGNSGKLVMSETSFWLIPYKLVAAVGLGLLLLIALIIVIRRHLLHRFNNEQARIKMLEERLQELEKDQVDQFKD